MNWLKVVAERYRVSADPIRTERRIELVVVLLALLLTLQLAYGLSRLAIISAPEAVSPTADSLQVINAFGQNTVTPEQNTEIRSRPLLWPARRPVASVAVAADESPSAKQRELDEIKLLGVFGAGDTLGVIVRVKEKAQQIQVGEEIAGWTLKSVEKSRAVFAAGSRQKTLTLLPEQIERAEKVKKRSKAGGK